MPILTDADVFGDSAPAPVPSAPLPATPAPGGDLLTDADVFGSAPTKRKVAAAPAPTPAPERSMAREGFALADLLTTGIVQGIGDVFSQAVGRTVAAASGASREDSIKFGKEFGQSFAEHPAINQPLTKLFNWVSGHEPNTTRVDDLMGKVSEYISKGGDWVEQKTGGAITKGDVELLTEAVMAGGGGSLARKVTGGRIAPREGVVDVVPKAAEPAPTTPTAQAAVRDVQADVNASTGVTATKDALAQKQARREQARQAFKEDPDYADYLRNYAEEEARLRSLQPPPLSASGGLSQTGPRAPRTGLREAPTEQPTPMTPAEAIQTAAPDALDTALQKVREGRSFDLTAEERVRLRNQGQAPQIYVPPSQRGMGTQRGIETLAVLNGAAGGLLALSSMLRGSDYTLKTLERLPQNRTEFTREQIMQQLNRADVSKAEKDLVTGVMGDKEKISARDLVEGFQAKGESLKLQPKEVQDYASYGLDSIDRFTKDMMDRDAFADRVSEVGRQAAEAEAEAQTVPARTTVYRNRELNDTNNHFDDPRYFAHTRSFDEGGVRHVVEIQSDVAQHAKATTPEARARLDDAMQATVLATKKLHSIDKAENFDGWTRANEELRQTLIKLHEARAAIGTDVPDAAQPLLKNWYKRVIREELQRSPEGKPTRFATADTVAKVEGWTDQLAAQRDHQAYYEGRIRDTEIELRDWQETLRTGTPPKNSYAETVKLSDPEFFTERLIRNQIVEVSESLQRDKAYLESLRSAPKIGRFSPEHQSIYDRYKGDIEKFLKSELGGKEVKDSAGHTWIEVPPQPRGPVRMFGRTDPASVAALAAFVGGAAAMHAWQDDPSLVADLVAGLVASSATRVRPGALVDTIRKAREAKPLESIGDLAVERDAAIRLAGIDTTNVVRQVTRLVPEEAGRVKVHEALDTGVVRNLTPKERAAYDLLRSEYDRLGKVGLDAETLKSTRANYATHMWKADSTWVERLLNRPTSYGTSANTPYALERAFATMAEGEKAGLKPLSKDAAFVFATYANSLVSAVENGRLVKNLRTAKTATGDLLVQKTADAPAQYVTIQNPQLRGLAVHPEIASQMRFIFENPSSAGVGAALEMIADVTKRSAVSASLFHAKALADVLVAAVPGKKEYFAGAAVGAAGAYGLATTFGDDHALREAALGGLAGYVGPRVLAYARGRSAFLEEAAKGSASDLVKRSVKSGLVFGTEKGPLVVDDAGRRFYDAMRVVQQEADRIAQPVGIQAGKPVDLYIKANHWMDDMMWGRLHVGMKLEVWSKTSDILRESSIERAAKNPKARILSQAEADQIAAKYTNDMFGGLNWTRLAMEAKTPLGRAVAQEMLSPKGRRIMRIMMFAPDWTISTARAALAAVDKDLVNPLKWGDVATGMFQPITRGDLARQYVARSALYYLAVGDAINYSMSGHHLWENEGRGWSWIDWGDGRWMQFSKHIMETPHWFEKPVKQGVSKLGYIPKEIANQALGTEYLAPSVGKDGRVFAGPKMQDPSVVGRFGHALGGLVPIPLQQGPDETFLWNFAGMPIYGKTAEQKEELRRQQAELKRQRDLMRSGGK